MCAIAGIIGPHSSARNEVETMLALMNHRGPDESGIFTYQNVCLGHNRLAIIDPKSKGNYPFKSPDGRYVLTFNGEIFNYKEIKAEIGNTYYFKTQMDTEVLLAAYLKWGKECLQKLRGMFAFAIYDCQTGKLFAARDHFGIKPFYYTQKFGTLLFASEIKPLLLNNNANPNYQTISSYLVNGHYDHSEETFFSHIHKLPPAHYLEFSNEKIEINSYWTLSNIEEQNRTEEEVEALVREKISELVNISIRSDVPLGINMSGGFDSSLLANLIVQSEEFAGGQLHCFNQDYKDSIYSERDRVKLNMESLASQSTAQLTYSYLTPDEFIAAHNAMQWHQEEPYAGVPVSGYVGIYQAAHTHGVTVLVDGNGLDEVAAGYKPYHLAYLQDLYHNKAPNLDAAIKAYEQEWGLTSPINQEDLKKPLPQSGVAADGTQSTHIKYLNQNILDLTPDSPPSNDNKFSSRCRTQMHQDLVSRKIPRALRFNDKVSMAFSKELRVPFLDKELFELCYSIPLDTLFKNQRPKGLLRSLYHNVGTPKVSQQPKQSIQTPQTQWLTNELFDWVFDTVTSTGFKQRELFNPQAIVGHLRDIRAGKVEIKNSFYLWQMVNTETWFNQFIDSPITSDKKLSFPAINTESNLNTEKSA